ncbi:MAG: DUF1934 domain-containing protein [Clostridia bacterium]|nr:DUF1934 domain-containing protein [Clostridia bacterium]
MPETGGAEKIRARFRIVSRMTDPQGETSEIKSARRGTLTQTGARVQIEYDDERDGEKARIALDTDGKSAVMRRRGMTSAELRFEPGRKTNSAYVTLYGEIPVAVYTRSVNLEAAADGGTLRLDYDVFAGGEKTASTRLELTWRA